MDRDTSGFKGWKEVRFHEGKGPDGRMIGSEGFRHVVTGQDFKPEKGWDEAPPCPTGDLACTRHVSEAYREGYERINWSK